MGGGVKDMIYVKNNVAWHVLSNCQLVLFFIFFSLFCSRDTEGKGNLFPPKSGPHCSLVRGRAYRKQGSSRLFTNEEASRQNKLLPEK